jgi:hypothetical protein
MTALLLSIILGLLWAFHLYAYRCARGLISSSVPHAKLVVYLNAAAALFRISGDFTVEQVFAEAKRRTGLHELDHEREAQLKALYEARLATARQTRRFFIKQFWYKNLVSYCSTQLRLHQLRESSQLPKLNHPIQRVAIIGLPRTGTTHLHRLISSNGDAFSFIPFWRMMTPFPLPTHEKPERFKIFALSLFLKMFQLKPHPIEAQTPDEDSQMFRLTTLGDLQAALGFSGSGPLYEFMLTKINSGIDRFAVQDYCDQFRAEVSLNDKPGKLWICKDPLASVYLPTWLSTFDNIGDRKKFIWTHRDPVNSITSLVSLCRHFRLSTVDGFDAKWTAQIILENLSKGTNQLIRYRDSLSEEEQRQQFLDVSFREIQQNPIEVLKQIYSFLEIPFDKNALNTATSFQNKNRFSDYKHKYDSAELCVDAEQTKKKFEPYIRQFGSFF